MNACEFFLEQYDMLRSRLRGTGGEVGGGRGGGRGGGGGR